MMTREQTSKKLMRISPAAEAAGVSKQTIEYYIMLGLIDPIRRSDPRGRFFDKALVKRIRLIRRMNKSGYTLRDIRETYLEGKGRATMVRKSRPRRGPGR